MTDYRPMFDVATGQERAVPVPPLKVTPIRWVRTRTVNLLGFRLTLWLSRVSR